MTAFYFSIDCENCGEEIIDGLNVTTSEHNGRPVIPFDMASQSQFTCSDCGAVNYTGDFDVIVEV
jgi:hypothetical protein